ncbi:katanin p60 ATPase-containing subunit A-like 2 [Ixodes scapularis]|uniref:katanin p60 ATPase-containing subunit A-like 2 n=1 Tax=Ixodes scapularis TaxID=6945 RepID=UPI001AD6DFF5|nr:katanin p60 ATPase-containing subunit A-like 2 [Ixodes scapularis]
MAESKTTRSFIAGHLTDTEEQKSTVRKRNLLVLILHYLKHHGLLETVEALKTESNMKLDQYVLCDNIDLELILQEYETFQFVKFRKQPNIIRRPDGDGLDTMVNHTKTTKARIAQAHSTQTASNGGGSFVSAFRIRSLHRNTDEDKSKAESAPTKLKHSTESSFHPEHITIDRRLGIQICTPGMPQLKFPPAAGTSLGADWGNLVDIISKDVYVDSPNVHWSDIVGLDSAKRLIKEALIYPMKYPDIFSGIMGPWKGLLLFGPPGTGKTMLAKAVATECKTTFFNITASTLVSKWRGESEKLVRVLFEMARHNSPSTIFLDELDALVGARGTLVSSENEASRRMKSELLIQMDGLINSKDHVFVLATSNSPWDLDHAVLRRLEKRILVPLPGKDARAFLFHKFLAGQGGKDGRRGSSLVAPDVDYGLVSEASEGYSGSDIKVACKEAVMRSLRQALEAAETCSAEEDLSDHIAPEPVSTRDILDAVAQTKPTGKLLASRYETWHQEFGSSLS